MPSSGVLLEQYYRELVGYLRSRLGSRHAAEDIAQEAYLRILERCDDTQISHPRAFLYRTALNLVTDGHRRSKARRAGPLEILETDERFFVTPVHGVCRQEERLELLQRALAELGNTCRECFLLRKLEGLSHGEIATRMGLSKATVDKHIVNAMKHCRLRMREWAET